MLSRRIDRRESVFSVLGLSRGGGTRNANAYRALNMRRELLVDYDIRALFWLNKAESRSLSRIAPDFWAFRHRVIDFSPARDLDERILKGGRLALRQCRQAARLSPEDPSAWLSLGKTNLQLGLLEEARKAFERVLWLVPDHPRAWHGLGDVYRLGKQTTDAIINYRQAARLDPSFLPAQFSLIACYRLVALTDLAAEQIEAVRPSVKNESEYFQAVFASVCGNITEAVDLLASAIEHHQGSPDQIRRDPNLDFIRSEPRFLQLISRS
jgi:tetratricopeptide (TPR) repeat protein